MEVEALPEARREANELPLAERQAMFRAFDKLKVHGDRLPYPHSSLVKGTRLRELRPRAGRSPWRAFYERLGRHIFIAAIGPEAQHDPRGFRRAVDAASARLDEIRGELDRES